jgi:hypothetical protein
LDKNKLYLLGAAFASALISLFAVMGCFAAESQVMDMGQSIAYYVASDGDDDNPGSMDEPWATIQYAAENLQPGETVFVREGVYNELVSMEVSGSASGGYITFRNYPGEQPVLDGTGLFDPYGVNGIYIADKGYLIIQGFEIRNYKSSLRDNMPIGIQIEGASDHIQIRDNYIHHIETNAPVDQSLSGADAHGLVVYGSDENHPIQHLIIDGNELTNLKLGSSEALVLNGNVEFFTVTNNLVHDTDNIGMDFIGFEGMVPDPALDRARNGVVVGNTVYNVDAAGNPAYGGERSAGGIYVDGGRDIIIERNRVYSSNIGIEIASEHADGNTSNITVRNNFVYHNHIAGIAMGGYDTQRGYAENCVIVNNTLYSNDTSQDGNGELMLQYDTRNNIIKNNIFYANEQGVFISNIFTQNSGNQVDNNLYYSSIGVGSGLWTWKNVGYIGFESYRSATGNDTEGLFSDPLLINLDAPDLHLEAESPAVDLGEYSSLVGDFDIDGEPRIQGSAVDIGADEWVLRLYLALVSSVD